MKRVMPERAPRTVLAFDFGLHHIGVAVGEPGLGTTHPLPSIHARRAEARFAQIAKLIGEWHPAGLVVGVPVAEDGARHEVARRAERFARQLEGRFGLPVARVDERYSSVEAESRLRLAAGRRMTAKLSRGRALDSYAAQLILEQYLHEAAA
jgi:putative Holliday junction resolvase